MLNLVGFGEKKVSETAEMLNMLNFWGFGTSRAIFPISSKNPKKFNMFNISALLLAFLPPKPTNYNISLVGSKFCQTLGSQCLTLQLWESKNDSHSCNVKLGGF